MSILFSLALLRVKLLLRQKLGWIAALGGVATVLISLVTAQVSFVNPAKIFWDFALAAIFVQTVLLAIYLSVNLFHEERGRRTLHLLVASGLSRFQWLFGNYCGIVVGLAILNGIWFGAALILSLLSFGKISVQLPFQACLLIVAEAALLVASGIWLSLWVRPLVGIAALVSGTAFLHMANDIQRIFLDPQVGRLVDDRGLSVVFAAIRLLPPLDWLDIRSLVGYEKYFAWSQFFTVGLIAALWTIVFLLGAKLRFERMDL